MKTSTLAAAVLAALVPLSASARVHPRVNPTIYGADDRKEVYQADETKRKMACSTVALFTMDDVVISGSQAALKTTPFEWGDDGPLIKTERFRGQPQGAFCSGALIAPDVILTAGHCVRSQMDCWRTKFVFDFAYLSKGHDPAKVAADSVYGCRKLLKTEDLTGKSFLGTLVLRNFGLIERAADWALVKLDREVKGRQILGLGKSGVKPGDRVYTIGYPMGIPAKVTAASEVLNDQHGFPDFFGSHLDIYGGNSGSAVFNAETNLIEGIMAYGDADFERAPAPAAHKCPESGDELTDLLCELDNASPPEYQSNVLQPKAENGNKSTRVSAILSEIDAALKAQ